MDLAMRVANREVGGLPLSIGTSLAIEELLKQSDEWPEYLWINVKTLIRNLVSCIESDLRKQVLGKDLLPTLTQELLFLQEHITDETRGFTKTVFYHCDYTDLGIKFPLARLKVPSTPLQEAAAAVEYDACRELLANSPVEIHTFATQINGNNTKSLIVSHFPIDLLWSNSFSKLRLLESYTGTIKGPGEWNTKLTNGKQLERIPFNRLTIQIFGDDNVTFSAMPPTIKKSVLELADSRNWTSVSSLELIKSHIEKMSDVVARELLIKILRA